MISVRSPVDSAQIWINAQNEHGIGVKIPNSNSCEEFDENKKISKKRLTKATNSVYEILGLDASIEAYYHGVPLSDIVA